MSLKTYIWVKLSKKYKKLVDKFFSLYYTNRCKEKNFTGGDQNDKPNYFEKSR